jgi:hypothetical protein
MMPQRRPGAAWLVDALAAHLAKETTGHGRKRALARAAPPHRKSPPC